MPATELCWIELPSCLSWTVTLKAMVVLETPSPQGVYFWSLSVLRAHLSWTCSGLVHVATVSVSQGCVRPLLLDFINYGNWFPLWSAFSELSSLDAGSLPRWDLRILSSLPTIPYEWYSSPFCNSAQQFILFIPVHTLKRFNPGLYSA